MVSRSYSNLLDLASGDAPVPSFGRKRKRFPGVATVAGILSDLDDEKSVGSDAPSSVSLERMIIVGNQLPLRAHLGPGRKRMAQLKSEWTLLLTSLILEMASAVFDQLGYALVGMVLAFVALLLATADLIHMARKERMSLLPIFYRPSTATFVPWKPAGTIVEYFGLVGAVWQCFYSTVEYAYARQKKDSPIKMSLLPFFFLLCVVISKLIKK